MLICGHCGDTVKDLHGLAVHLCCEEKPLPLVVVENTSTNTPSQQLLHLVAILKASSTISTTAVLKVLYAEYPQLLA